MQAFLLSCQRQGLTCLENSLDADAVVIWSVLWSGKMAPNRQVYQHYQNRGRPIIVMDVGALDRGKTWKIAVGNVNAEGYYGHTSDLDWDRPRKLGLSLQTNKAKNPSILIAAQHKSSLQLQHLVGLEYWIADQIQKIREWTDRRIIVRAHPRCGLDPKLLPKDIDLQTPKHIKDTYDNFDLGFEYQALVNYNSGPGIQAVIHGCPVIVDRSSLAYPMNTHYEDIEKRQLIDRERWFVEITHTEYTVEEISQGRWLSRIRSALIQ